MLTNCMWGKGGYLKAYMCTTCMNYLWNTEEGIGPLQSGATGNC